MPVTLNCCAKINLGLRIGPVRADGFHQLATVYQTIALADVVTLRARPAQVSEIVIRCSDARVPTDARNTCWQMVEAAMDALEVNARVEIDIEKRLPVQGGLGAGSANAAAALLALERELAGHVRALTPQERLEIAARIGSDVPLFLLGGTVWGTGRGELVAPLADSPAIPCVVAVPDCAVSTPQAFRDWDSRAQGSPGDHPSALPALTPADEFATLNELNRSVAAIWRVDDSSGVFSPDPKFGGEGLAENPLLALVQTGIENDFESVVFPQHPLLRDLKLALAGSTPDTPRQNQAVYAALSGSGAALFGLYRTGEAAAAAAQRVQAMGSKALITSTLPRAQWESQLAVSS